MARARWWLREDYAHHQTFKELWDAAFEGVYGLRGRFFADRDTFLRYQAIMLPSTGDLEFEIRPKRSCRGWSTSARSCLLRAWQCESCSTPQSASLTVPQRQKDLKSTPGDSTFCCGGLTGYATW
jgi:hypothetical protein